MPKRLLFYSGLAILAILVAIIVWQGSFSFGPLAPASVEQTYLFWAVSTLIFILTVTLGFMLFRTAVKLYIERRSHKPGSHIRSKLVAGALALTFLPVFFLVLFSVYVLNYNLAKWFSRPAEAIQSDLVEVGNSLSREANDRITAQAHWLAAVLASGDTLTAAQFCDEHHAGYAAIQEPAGNVRVICGADARQPNNWTYARVVIPEGTLILAGGLPLDLAAKKVAIDRSVHEYNRLAADKNSFRRLYLELLLLITLFILFFATWLARYLAGQISVPITALLTAAQQIRKGNLGYRVNVTAVDEMKTLVNGFNDMSVALETNDRELNERRRFTEAILESIPTGVISLAADGKILLVNRALKGIFPEEQVRPATKLDDLFSRDDVTEIRYLMNRARRTGVAATQIEYKLERRVLHLALTVAALDEKRNSGFVLVVEDTSELLRAQKSTAWHEVARRVAHEIKNPLTPIALCADRIARQLDRNPSSPETDRILRECSVTIAREVESVKTLVDEFSQFSRFPAAHPVPSDLNEIVEGALTVFNGRLDGIEMAKDLAPALPPVNVDPEHFRRVVVNLVDNAAEAMQDSGEKRLFISTRSTEADSIELIIADTGHGISREDKEKLFLPYFSTKGRGTGLGLAIVNRICSDHDAAIRVEDNSPTGARFIVDIPVVEVEPSRDLPPANRDRLPVPCEGAPLPGRDRQGAADLPLPSRDREGAVKEHS
jgi:two-component system nitrogen regulation sensor histidine kinase NtrY